MKKAGEPIIQKLSSSRKRLYNFIIILFPFLVLFILEMLLLTVGYGDHFKLFVDHPDPEYAGYKVVNPEIGKKYFQRFEYSHPAKDLFLKQKPDSVFRIFVMGSSTVVGFPYDNNLMFSRIVHERLREAYPGKRIEVVNTAITAINSFTLLDFMPSVLSEKPDAILFYTGHNEFYGALGAGSSEATVKQPALINLHLKLMKSRVYQLVRNSISGMAGIFSGVKSPADKRGTLMTRIVGDAAITFDSPTYRKGMNYYRRNLELMLAMAKNRNVPVFIGDLVCNLSDLKPFKSLATHELKSAIDYFNEGKNEEQKGNIDTAKNLFSLARDYDCIRFRASSDVNRIIQDLASKYGATLVPVMEQFEQESPDGLIGSALLTEHVHPNVEGYFLMADAFYQALVASKLPGNEPDRNASLFNRNFMENYGYTVLDRRVGYHRVTNLSYHWPFVDESAAKVDYRQIYKPVSVIDSLAFGVMAFQSESLTDTHLKLAKAFEARGDFRNAFREYNALTKINPYWPVWFRNAADCLLKLSDLTTALRYFLRSLEYGNSFYAHYRIGEILMLKNDIDGAVDHFEEALILADKEKPNVLAKLYVAYAYQGNKEQFELIGKEIASTMPGKKIAIPPRSYSYLNYIPSGVKDYIARADDYLNASRIKEAENELMKSLEIMDSPIARRKLGEIMYRDQRIEQALFHLQKVTDDYFFDPNFLHLMVSIYKVLGNRDQSERYLKQLRKVDPAHPGLQEP